MSDFVDEMRERDELLHLRAKLREDELNPVESFCPCSRCRDERDRRRLEEREEG